jgi:hypothetical protein
MNFYLKRLNIIPILIFILFYFTCYPSTCLGTEKYGVAWGAGNYEESNYKIMSLLQNAGIKWITITFRWDEIEKTKGNLDLEHQRNIYKIAKEKDINIVAKVKGTPKWANNGRGPNVPPIVLNDFKIFMEKIISSFKGNIKYWQIWGEPDIPKFWKGTPLEYVELLKVGYQVIKSGCNDCKVLSAGLDGNGENYLKLLIDDNFYKYCDIISFHPYAPTPEASQLRAKIFTSIVISNNINKPVWFTEIGYQSGGWKKGPGVVSNENVKAEYLIKVFNLLEPYAEKIFWYRAAERPNMYGLIEIKNDDIFLTPAYYALKGLIASDK